MIKGGISASLDEARQNMRANLKNFNSIVPIAYGTFRLGEGVALDAIAQGDFVSVENDRCYPLSADKPFGGICHAFSQDASGVLVTIATRGAVNLIIKGLTTDHRRGTIVSSEPREGRQPSNVLNKGIAIGQLYQTQDLERSTGVVCFRAASDERPFTDIYSTEVRRS